MQKAEYYSDYFKLTFVLFYISNHIHNIFI